MQITITLDDKKLFEQIRKDDDLAAELSDTELQEELDAFVKEMSTPEGFSQVLTELDYFNY